MRKLMGRAILLELNHYQLLSQAKQTQIEENQFIASCMMRNEDKTSSLPLIFLHIQLHSYILKPSTISISASSTGCEEWGGCGQPEMLPFCCSFLLTQLPAPAQVLPTGCSPS